MTQFIEGVDNEVIPSRTLFNKEKKLVFDPAVYEQRYMKVIKILGHPKLLNHMKSIVEFGCAEMKFFVFLKNGLRGVTKVDLVDIDGELIERSKNRTEPLTCEYLKKREQPLTVNVWQGNVALPNENFKNCDAVIAIELIEHVFPDVLEKIPFNIFGFIKPKIAVLTTPNREFNVLFNMPPGTFRHDDHKFEWTRSEFEDWCHHICARFPDYCVQFHGVGNPPTEHQNLGSCSQLGFFIRKDFFESLNKEPAVEVSHPEIVECDNYQLIHSVAYPFFRDLRQRHEKIFDECNYHLNRFRWMEDQYFNWGSDRFEIPLKHVANACWEITDNIEEIRGLVKENFQLENDFVIFPPNIED